MIGSSRSALVVPGRRAHRGAGGGRRRPGRATSAPRSPASCPSVDGVDGRDPRRRLVPRADRGRGPHGHRRGLHGRAVPALPARRHRRAEPPVDRDLPERRPPGGGRHPGRGHRGGTRRRTGVGGASPTAAPTPGTTTGCTGWTTSSPSVDRGEPVPGAYDPWRVPIVVDGAAAEVQGILVYEESVSPLPYLGLAVIVAGLLGFYGRGPGLRLAAGAAGGGVARRGRGRVGRLLVHPRRRREPAALGAGRRRRS